MKVKTKPRLAADRHHRRRAAKGGPPWFSMGRERIDDPYLPARLRAARRATVALLNVAREFYITPMPERLEALRAACAKFMEESRNGSDQ